jgi:hypothetical protein
MRGFGWSCVALYCLVQLGIVSPDWLKGQWKNLTYRQNPASSTPGEVDRAIGNDDRSLERSEGNLYD